MEELKSKLQSETNRREIFERKNAELEVVNDNLRSENDRLLTEVDTLRKRLTLLETAEADQSESSSEEEESPNFSNGTRHNPNSSSLSTNGNHSNSNSTSEGGGGGGGGGRDEKILTLKRKQKVLKAELEESLCKTMGFQEAFQNEMDLRTKLEEKYESLYLRYERLVLENDHFRKVLTNHCIDVPQHQPITKRRPRNSSNPPPSSLRPPSFIPPGRQRNTIGSTGSGSGGGSRSSSRAGRNSSPSHSISSHSSADPDSATPPAGNSTFELSGSSTGKASFEGDDLDRINALTGDMPLNGNAHGGRPHPLSMLTSSSTMTDSESEEEGRRGEGVEHIVLEPAPTTPSITQDIDAALVTTADQIANAKAFYQHIRQKMEEEAEHSDS